MGDAIAIMIIAVGGTLAFFFGVIALIKWSDDPRPKGLRGKARRLEAENTALRALVASLHERAVQGRDVDPVCAVCADEIEAVMHAEVTFKTPGGYGNGERQKR